MCGINGKITTQEQLISQEIIHKMNEKIIRRGPDAEGIELFRDGSNFVGFGHRRLKIIDLSDSANQPFVSDDGKVVLVFNGEIYNFQELKKEYFKDDIFKTTSDTEVILKLYQKFGIELVYKLRGMFAIAIYDKTISKLCLLRDHLGKKPLFYYQDNNSFIFSSQIKPILENAEVKKELDLAVLDDYLSFNYIPGDNSIYKNIKKLPPASYLEFSAGKVSIKKYWQLNYTEKISLFENDIIKRVDNLLHEATKMRMIADVPLGAFLSGGIDSSLIVAIMARYTDKVKTFSIGFDQKDFSELAWAKKIADQFKTEHHEFVVRPNMVDIIDDLVDAFEEPYADPSQIPMYYLSKLTREHVTVALNGDGGDESFAGYERYLGMFYQDKYRRVPKVMRSTLYNIIKNLPENTAHHSFIRRFKWLNKISLCDNAEAYLQIYRSFDDELKNKLYTDNMRQQIGSGEGDSEFLRFFNSNTARELTDKILNTDVNTYLPQDLLVKADRSTMFHSLEGRSPFLDYKLMEYAASIPAKYKLNGRNLKYLLKKIAENYLPKEIIYRKKQGFGVPLGSWFRNELKEYLLDLFSASELVNNGIMNRAGLDNLINEHLAGKINHGRRLFTLVILEKWLQSGKMML